VFDRRVPPSDWFASYVSTYVERDARQILNVTDLSAFQAFVKMCAGRIGQLVNLSALASDCGITHNTAKAWLSVLEASDLVVRLQPWHANLGKRLIKAPKLYFLDSGLACSLLGIRSAAQLMEHPLRGGVFENWVMLEVLKARLNRGLPADMFFFRSRAGMEVDFLVETGHGLVAIEAKSGQTVSSDFLKSLAAFRALPIGRPVRAVVVYGGDAAQRRQDATVAPWHTIGSATWW
jgi:predicted AAA+ superfamily ATPase